MVVSFVIPFIVMVFASISIDKVWGLYNMLQVVSLCFTFKLALIPSNAMFVLQLFYSIANFSLGSNQIVRNLLSQHFAPVLSVITDLGEATLVIIILCSIVLIVSVLPFIFRFKKTCLIKLRERIYKKLVFNSFLRSAIQSYIKVCMLQFGSIVNLMSSGSISF